MEDLSIDGLDHRLVEKLAFAARQALRVGILPIRASSYSCGGGFLLNHSTRALRFALRLKMRVRSASTIPLVP